MLDDAKRLEPAYSSDSDAGRHDAMRMQNIYCVPCGRSTSGKLYCDKCGHIKSYMTVDLSSPEVVIGEELRNKLKEQSS